MTNREVILNYLLDKSFMMCVGCGGVTSLLLAFGKLDAGIYLAIIGLTIGAYISGDVAKNNSSKKYGSEGGNKDSNS